MTPATEPRRFLLNLYAAALARVDGRAAVRVFLGARPAERFRIVAIGKAAAAMALGAFDVLDRHAGALVITKHGYGDTRLAHRATLLEAGHPTPDAASLAAGEALLKFLGESATDQPFLFLLSGGASALVEVLPEGVTLEELSRANTWLLGAGLDIAAANRVRKGLSCIKQGRLARLLGGRPALCLLVSDVPGDDPSVIASGLLVADREDRAPLPSLPAWLAGLMTRVPAPPAAEDACFARIETCVLATNRDAQNAAADAACAAGLPVHRHEELLGGDVAQAADRIAHHVLTGAPGVYVWGGETTVRLPHPPGRGGRCQQLALLLAQRIEQREDLFVLAVGTDGSDGPGEDAGALVDGTSVARGVAEGCDPRDAVARADAGTFLEASGDLVATGPTGTNVMDLVLAFKRAPRDKLAP